jgi:Sigma-70 region 2
MWNLAAMHPSPQHQCRTSPPEPQTLRRNRVLSIEASTHRSKRLRRYARAIVHDPVAADDLVQDCLVRALGRIHQWQEGTDLRAWLFTILHNRYISLARRAARERNHLELQRDYLELALSPNQTARLALRDLDRAIAKLPEEQRAGHCQLNSVESTFLAPLARGQPYRCTKDSLHRTVAPPTAGGYHPCLRRQEDTTPA